MKNDKLKLISIKIDESVYLGLKRRKRVNISLECREFLKQLLLDLIKEEKKKKIRLSYYEE